MEERIASIRSLAEFQIATRQDRQTIRTANSFAYTPTMTMVKLLLNSSCSQTSRECQSSVNHEIINSTRRRHQSTLHRYQIT